jgi:hypothetical protein
MDRAPLIMMHVTFALNWVWCVKERVLIQSFASIAIADFVEF